MQSLFVRTVPTPASSCTIELLSGHRAPPHVTERCGASRQLGSDLNYRMQLAQTKWVFAGTARIEAKHGLLYPHCTRESTILLVSAQSLIYRRH